MKCRNRARFYFCFITVVVFGQATTYVYRWSWDKELHCYTRSTVIAVMRDCSHVHNTNTRAHTLRQYSVTATRWVRAVRHKTHVGCAETPRWRPTVCSVQRLYWLTTPTPRRTLTFQFMITWSSIVTMPGTTINCKILQETVFKISLETFMYLYNFASAIQ